MLMRKPSFEHELDNSLVSRSYLSVLYIYISASYTAFHVGGYPHKTKGPHNPDEL
jgi:hypothetical protein